MPGTATQPAARAARPTAATLSAALWSQITTPSRPASAAARTIAAGCMSSSPHGERHVCTCMSNANTFRTPLFPAGPRAYSRPATSNAASGVVTTATPCSAARAAMSASGCRPFTITMAARFFSCATATVFTCRCIVIHTSPSCALAMTSDSRSEA